jgi:hypothetical protein
MPARARRGALNRGWSIPTAVAAAKAAAAWPEGNDVESGSETSASMPGSASGGRARSVTCFSSAARPSAISAAVAPRSAAVGSHRRLAASQQPPAAAMSGHLTHHADAITKTAVRGPQ